MINSEKNKTLKLTISKDIYNLLLQYCNIFNSQKTNSELKFCPSKLSKRIIENYLINLDLDLQSFLLHYDLKDINYKIYKSLGGIK